jgi:hypothetical protein
VGEERLELRVVLSERMGVTAFALSWVDGGWRWWHLDVFGRYDDEGSLLGDCASVMDRDRLNWVIGESVNVDSGDLQK